MSPKFKRLVSFCRETMSATIRGVVFVRIQLIRMRRPYSVRVGVEHQLRFLSIGRSRYCIGRWWSVNERIGIDRSQSPGTNRHAYQVLCIINRTCMLLERKSMLNPRPATRFSAGIKRLTPVAPLYARTFSTFSAFFCPFREICLNECAGVINEYRCSRN